MKQITIIRMVDQIKSPFTGQLSTQNHTVVRSSARSDPITVHWPAVNTVPHGGQVERWIRSNHRSLPSGQHSTTRWSGRVLDQIQSPFTVQWSTQYHTVVRSKACGAEGGAQCGAHFGTLCYSPSTSVQNLTEQQV